MNKKYLSLIAVSLVLVSCAKTPKEAYYDRGNPESLLDYSSEVVNLKIQSAASVSEMTRVINKNQPTRAEVSCNTSSAICNQVKKVMAQFKVKTKYTDSNKNTVALVYEKVLARDCQSRYIDNPRNQENLNYPTLGCANAVNMVQMVTDKKEFTNPALMETPDAGKSVQAIENYNLPSKPSSDFPATVSNYTSTNISSR